MVDKNEVEGVVKGVLGKFTPQYSKHYVLALAEEKEEEVNKVDKGYKLTKRPEDEVNKDDLKCGLLTKEGGVRKSWKKRWFVVRYNFVVDYYTDEKTAGKAKAKPKGTMNLAGYSVNEDVGASLLKKAKELAEKMGMDLSELPKGKQYPEFTFEVYHPRRRCYYIQASSEEEKQEWVAMFNTCCRRAWGLTNTESCHVRGFENAIRETRWELGRWGWGSYGGSEEQQLSDLISTELDYQVMGNVYSKLSGPWMVRNAARNQALKVIDTMVSSAVVPAWKGMASTVAALRPKVEPVIGDMVVPLASTKTDILGKITDAVTDKVVPLMDEHIKPHLGRILEIIKGPVSGAFESLIGLVGEKLSSFGSEIKDDATNFRELDYFGRSYWSNRPALDKLNVMAEPLYLLREIFSDISPWGSIWKGQAAIMKACDNAMYTFQIRVKALGEKTSDAIQQVTSSVMDDLKHDVGKRILRFFTRILKDILMPPLQKVVLPVVKAVLDPLQDAVPDAMKQFIDIMKLFDRFLNNTVDSLINPMLE